MELPPFAWPYGNRGRPLMGVAHRQRRASAASVATVPPAWPAALSAARQTVARQAPVTRATATAPAWSLSVSFPVKDITFRNEDLRRPHETSTPSGKGFTGSRYENLMLPRKAM